MKNLTIADLESTCNKIDQNCIDGSCKLMTPEENSLRKAIASRYGFKRKDSPLKDYCLMRETIREKQYKII